MRAESRRPKRPDHIWTPQEDSILLSEAMSRKQIAWMLGIGITTVDRRATHLGLAKREAPAQDLYRMTACISSQQGKFIIQEARIRRTTRSNIIRQALDLYAKFQRQRATSSQIQETNYDTTAPRSEEIQSC